MTPPTLSQVLPVLVTASLFTASMVLAYATLGPVYAGLLGSVSVVWWFFGRKESA